MFFAKVFVNLVWQKQRINEQIFINDEALNKPPLHEFQFADEKEKVFWFVRHSRAEKRFGWNVTSAQKTHNDRTKQAIRKT
jgi:hypothetical protein